MTENSFSKRENKKIFYFTKRKNIKVIYLSVSFFIFFVSPSLVLIFINVWFDRVA